MRRVAQSLASLALFAAVLVVGPRAASATAALPPPEVELWAQGAPIPDKVQLWEFESGRRTKAGPKTVVLDGSVRRLLRRVATAHRADDPAPFLEALAHPSAYARHVTIEGLVFGRVADGYSGGLHTWEHARRVDVAFVERFVPELMRLAREPRVRTFSHGNGDTQHHAVEALSHILPHMAAGKQRDEAAAAMVDALLASKYPYEAIFVTRLLSRHPGIALSEEHGAQLAKRLRASLPDEPPTELDAAARTRGEWVHYLLGLLPRLADKELAARVSKSQTLDADYLWLRALAKLEDPRARELVAAFMAEPTRQHFARGMPLEFAQFATPAWVEPLARWTKDNEPDGPSEGSARILAQINTPEATALLRARCIETLERGVSPHLAVTRIWLEQDSAAPENIRNRIRVLSPQERVALLGGMGAVGIRGVLPSILSYLDVRGAPDVVRCAALRALGMALTQTAGQDPTRRARALARLRSLMRARPLARRCVPEGLRFARRAIPQDFEGVLVDAVGWGGLEDSSQTWSLMKMLGQFGGKLSHDALVSHCSYPSGHKRVGWVINRALYARQAVGQLEARLTVSDWPVEPFAGPGPKVSPFGSRRGR